MYLRAAFRAATLVGKMCAVVVLAHMSVMRCSNAEKVMNIPQRQHEYGIPLNNELHGRGLVAPTYDFEDVLTMAEKLLLALPTNITETCARQSTYMLENLRSVWALKMLDSMGKPSAGILEGNFNWLGDFDECLNVQTDANSNVSFSGRYCKLSMPISLAGQPLALGVGACVPSGCNSNDTTSLFNTVLLLARHNGSGFTADCHNTDRPLDVGACVAIVVCSLFGLLLIAGTLLDVVRNISISSSTSNDTSLVQREKSVNGSDEQTNEKLRVGEYTPLLNARKQREQNGREGLCTKLLLSFSIYTNAQKLLSTAQSESTLSCLHGIRFLSMCWVIMGHTYVFSMAILGDGSSFYSQVLNRQSFQVIFNSSVSVDSFFLLSGLLVAYITLKELEKRSGRLSVKEWVLIYVHRYIRLTAVYALLLMIWACLASYFYDGPSWPTSGSLDVPCTKYWWTNLVYINNFVPTRADGVAACMDWTWYLANDMQFFLVTPLLAFLLYRVWYVGVGFTSLMIVASVAAAAAVSLSDSLKMSFLNAENPAEAGAWFDDLYIKPWCRFQSYGIGILLGYVLYLKKGKTQLSLFVVIAGWLVAALCCLTVLYAPYPAEFGSRSATATLGESAAYNGLSRTAWAVGLSWLIFACCTDNGGWVNTLLSWKPFIPLGRLTYCAYLIHPILLTVAELSSRSVIRFDDVTMVLRFLGTLVLSMSLAFVASVSFEAPVMGVEKLLFQSRKKI